MHPDLEKLLDLQSKDLALKAVDTALAEVLDAETALDDRLKRAEREVESDHTRRPRRRRRAATSSCGGSRSTSCSSSAGSSGSTR